MSLQPIRGSFDGGAVKVLGVQSMSGVVLGTKGALSSGFLHSALRLSKDNLVSQIFPSSKDLEFSSLLKVMLNQAIPRRQCEGGEPCQSYKESKKIKGTRPIC